MSSIAMERHDQGRRLVVAVMGIGLVVLLLASFIYRLQHPGLTMQSRQDTAETMAMTEIAELMTQLETQPNHLPTLMTLGDHFMRMGAWDRAIVFWKRALAVDPEEDQAMNGLGVAYYNQEQFAESARQFEDIIALRPDDHRAHFNLAMLNKYYLERPDLARMHFERVLEINPDDAGMLQRVQEEMAELTQSPG